MFMWPDLHFHSLPERSFAPAPFELMRACGLEQAMHVCDHEFSHVHERVGHGGEGVLQTRFLPF